MTKGRIEPSILEVKALSHPIVIIRHLKERRSKCSVQPFVGKSGFFFYNAKPGFEYDATGHIVLSINAPLLTEDDGQREVPVEGGELEPEVHSCLGFEKRPLLLLDSTWRRLSHMAKCVKGSPLRRSLPDWVRTAYPRKGQFQEDPEEGLATVEALYCALRIMGEDRPDILNQYHWKSLFLRQFDERECFG